MNGGFGGPGRYLGARKGGLGGLEGGWGPRSFGGADVVLGGGGGLAGAWAWGGDATAGELSVSAAAAKQETAQGGDEQKRSQESFFHKNSHFQNRPWRQPESCRHVSMYQKLIRRSPWGSWTARPRYPGTYRPDCTGPSSPGAGRSCQGWSRRWPGRRDGGGLSHRESSRR